MSRGSIMRLHENKEVFKEVIGATAAKLNFEEFQIEKDYYVSLLLKKLVEVSPEIVFKGGTSLSKCYNAIDRFSEDIDININFDQRANMGEKKAFKLSVLRAIEEVGFKLLNNEVNPPIETRSGRDFNMYLAGYNKEFVSESAMVDHIIVETNVSYRAFPCEVLNVSNYVTKYLSSENELELITNYELNPFEMNVQTIDRTFIDKLFAVCDYYEDKISDRYSRHLYDIHMIWQQNLVQLEQLRVIVPDIIEIRKPGRNTHSCKVGYRVLESLRQIIDTEFYKEDFEKNTKEFLSVEVSYDEVITSLEEIINSELLPQTIR